MKQIGSRLTSPESVMMSAERLERLERIAPALQKYVRPTVETGAERRHRSACGSTEVSRQD